MSSEKSAKSISDRFIQEMKLSNVILVRDDDSSPQNQDQDTDRSARKSVKFAMDRSVRFGGEQEEIEW